MPQRATYRKGDIIITEGDYSSEAYILLRGSVEVYLKGPPERHLRILRTGDIFGEMALITEQPRSANVRALEDVEVNVITHDEFLTVWRSEPDALLPMMRVLCERIRALTSLVAELSPRVQNGGEAVRAFLGIGGDAAQAPAQTSVQTPAQASAQPQTKAVKATIVIEGLTPQAQENLGGQPITVNEFPCRIGRKAEVKNPLYHNELSISDAEPFQVSRNHCMVGWLDGRCFLVDRGSRLGTVVNGERIGGAHRAARAPGRGKRGLARRRQHALPPPDHRPPLEPPPRAGAAIRLWPLLFWAGGPGPRPRPSSPR